MEVENTILIVEDDTILRSAVAKYLRANGFIVVEAANAAEAIDVLAATKVHAVFTDVEMPGTMNGHDLARWIEHKQPDLPVLLASGTFSEMQYPLAENFFFKPYDLPAVRDRLMELLGSSASDERA